MTKYNIPTIKTLNASKKALIEAYETTGRPGEAVAATIEAIGYAATVQIIATMVNDKAWDGRISDKAKAWAAEHTAQIEDETAPMSDWWAGDAIHMAHLDQIASAMMRTPEPEPEPEEPAEGGSTMTYTIKANQQFNSIEISFAEKPEAAIRDALKEARFRWHSVKKVWYGYTSEAEIRRILGKSASETSEATTETSQAKEAPAKAKKASPSKEEVRAEFAKAWASQKMVDYCTNKTAAVAVLPSGQWITVDKRGIEKDFCFGESGYDYEDAVRMARHARTSEEYFKSENMKGFRSAVKDLEEVKDPQHGSTYILTIHGTQYDGQAEDCKLARLEFTRMTEVLEDLGGSAYLADLPGQTITGRHNGHIYRIATNEEIGLIIAAYTEAMKAHEKKVDAYLKRYGTSKVHSWTYWRDA